MIESLNKIIAKLEQLPESEQERIAMILLKEVENPEFKAVYSTFSLENQPFVGMWKDRAEMQNSSDWVRQLRRKQWQG
ncbi:hypothetical protein VB715_15740 [Crocosphaera sp. UHCC 0190]|uniref:hypothetical protein n=1 Tax=Crocosphaera sp. UHCC 0190 TaxID=3110246 RepID=UPI002B215537|nr:hypothetical protein [Crocosphaera sp. UHCC 0190]MEA5511225.1 hypothetical protein [Crocosphaera sp. UHCC 0190]